MNQFLLIKKFWAVARWARRSVKRSSYDMGSTRPSPLSSLRTCLRESDSIIFCAPSLSEKKRNSAVDERNNIGRRQSVLSIWFVANE